MVTASNVINKAIAWEGYNEHDGSYKVILNSYGKIRPLPRDYMPNGYDEWCAIFVSAVAREAGALGIIPAECSCPKMIELFKKKNCWRENENVVPEKGWVIFYDWQDSGKGDNKGVSDHVGYVVSVSKSGIITVIEGNKGERVARRLISVNGRYIRGYGVPKYDKPKPSKPKPSHKKPTETLVKEVINGKWGNGEDRVNRLKKAGYDPKEVQNAVNKALSKKSIKTIAKEVVDGKWGNGKTRTDKLKKAGYSSKEIQAIQKEVNRLC